MFVIAIGWTTRTTRIFATMHAASAVLHGRIETRLPILAATFGATSWRIVPTPFAPCVPKCRGGANATNAQAAIWWKNLSHKEILLPLMTFHNKAMGEVAEILVAIFGLAQVGLLAGIFLRLGRVIEATKQQGNRIARLEEWRFDLAKEKRTGSSNKSAGEMAQ